MYFVHRSYAATLSVLHELVGRFGAGIHLSCVPIPDQDEMREKVIAAFTTKTRDSLSKLAADIAAAQREDAREATLATRFRDLQASAAEHAQLLNTLLDDTTAALAAGKCAVRTPARQSQVKRGIPLGLTAW